MKRPTRIMKILGILLLLTLFFLSATIKANASQISLTSMEKQESISSTKLTLYFSALPTFETNHSGQRVDLLLPDTLVSTKLHNLPEDETVVKILLAQKPRDLLVSVLLRRPPVQVVTESLRDPARVVIDLYWGEDQSSRPGVAFRIADLPPRKPGEKARELGRQSPWEGHWRDFFRDYRSSWTFNLPLTFTPLQMPPLISDQQSPLWPLQQLATEQSWLRLLRDATALSELDEQQQEQLNLLSAEAQLRTGQPAAAQDRLRQLQAGQVNERIRVDYLTAYAQAVSGQPMVAQLTLQGLIPDLPAVHPMALPVYLLAAETALAAKQEQLALSYLQNSELVWPDSLLQTKKLRVADAQVGLNEVKQALETYRDLVDVPGLYEFYPQSCNLAAFSAFNLGDYALATRLYRKLSEQVRDERQMDLLLFATGLATYESGDLDWGLITLQKATLEYPGTEGADRAALRLIDHKLLTEGELGMAQATGQYGQLGAQSVSRVVREEARFKQALAQDLLGDHGESVKHLMQFRREFSSSTLRRETDLLLLEQIPPLVESLLERKQELQAVVLVEQNRNLLLRGGFSRDFLKNLSGAFDRLGLYDRAGRVLLYLFDQSADAVQQQPIYLPLASSYLKRGEYAMASDYAGRYLEKYPQGEDRGALFGILLDAFAAEGRKDELLAWLNRADRPASPALDIRAAWIYWDQGKLPELVKCLERARGAAGHLEVKEMALLAEASYQLQHNAEARDLYQQLQNDPRFGTQARYRNAQLLLRTRQPEAALNLLAQLVDEGKNDPWSKLAQDLLIQSKQ